MLFDNKLLKSQSTVQYTVYKHTTYTYRFMHAIRNSEGKFNNFN